MCLLGEQWCQFRKGIMTGREQRHGIPRYIIVPVFQPTGYFFKSPRNDGQRRSIKDLVDNLVWASEQARWRQSLSYRER